MKLENERKVKYFEYDLVGLKKKEKDVFINYAKEHILKDENELINYALNKFLEDMLSLK